MRAKTLIKYAGFESGEIIEVEKPTAKEMAGGRGAGGYYTAGTDHVGLNFFFASELELLPDEPADPQSGCKVAADKQYGHPEFYKLLEQMAALHSRKNHDYAGTKDPLRNLKSSARLGLDPVTGVLVRLQDKMSRLESFAQQGELLVKDESVEDTLMDLAVYSLLGIILRREAKANG